MSRELSQFWLECLGARGKDIPNSIGSYNSEIFHPVGKSYDKKCDWVFEILSNHCIDKDHFCKVLPSSTDDLIRDVNIAFEDYVRNLESSSWEMGFKNYLLKSCNLSGKTPKKRKDILALIESEGIYEFLEISQITITNFEGNLISMFEFICPIE